MLVIFKAVSSSKTSVALEIHYNEHPPLCSSSSQESHLSVPGGELTCRIFFRDVETDMQIHPSVLILTTHGWISLQDTIRIPRHSFNIQIRASQQCRVTKPFRISFVMGNDVIAHSETIVILSAPPKSARGEKMAFARGETMGKKWKLKLVPLPSSFLYPVKYNHI